MLTEKFDDLFVCCRIVFVILFSEMLKVFELFFLHFSLHFLSSAHCFPELLGHSLFDFLFPADLLFRDFGESFEVNLDGHYEAELFFRLLVLFGNAVSIYVRVGLARVEGFLHELELFFIVDCDLRESCV